VNYKTISKVRVVNAINLYKEISIVSPTMLIDEEEVKTSVCMDEIRKIRDENFLRRLSQTKEETDNELQESLYWFVGEMAKRGNIVEVVGGKYIITPKKTAHV
jgi:hypothetical protein